MTLFRFRPELRDPVELVNGTYGIDAFHLRRVGDREILYGVGSAVLDNSCCGAFGCHYVLIVGEVVDRTGNGPLTANEALTIRKIDAPGLRDAIGKEVGALEETKVVNFYLPPEAVAAAANR